MASGRGGPVWPPELRAPTRGCPYRYFECILRSEGEAVAADPPEPALFRGPDRSVAVASAPLVDCCVSCRPAVVAAVGTNRRPVGAHRRQGGRQGSEIAAAMDNPPPHDGQHRLDPLDLVLG